MIIGYKLKKPDMNCDFKLYPKKIRTFIVNTGVRS